MLNHEFKKIEAMIDEKDVDNLDMGDFRNKLQGMAKEFDKQITPKRSPVKSVSRTMGKTKKGTKQFARNRINTFMNKMNEKIKNMSEQIDKRFNQEQAKNNDTTNSENSKEAIEERKTTTMTYEQKIEKTLRNDPDLLKATLAAMQINAMRNHIEESKDSLDQLNQINKDNPIEQYKIDDMKLKLHNHVLGMENKLTELEKSHKPSHTMQQLNEQSMEHENEHGRDEERTKDKDQTKQKEQAMER